MQKANQGPAARRRDGHGLAIGIVQARFNHDVTEAMASACIEELLRAGVASTALTHVTVPGALEIPLALQALAERGEHDALVAIGCVIRGETYHFELVADVSGQGIQRVSLDEGIPIANAVLTVENMAQALARAQPKGIDAAHVALEMAHTIGALQDAPAKP